VIPSQDAERLAIEAGEVDVMSADIRPDDLKAMRGLQAAGKVRLFDLGPAVDEDALWFNLGPDSRKTPAARPWLDRAVRRAVAHAVDRAAFVNTVYLGAAVQADGPVPPGNRVWYSDKLPLYAHDIPRARQLLADAGLRDVDGDGIFETSTGKPLAIELLTQRAARDPRTRPKSSPRSEGCRADVNVVPLDLPALIDRLTKHLRGLLRDRPATPTHRQPRLLASSGSFHLWHPKQKYRRRRGRRRSTQRS
jgi:peptide/nickel transport system substrate-binding protein